MDAVEFFQASAGQWRSQRTTHHLAFQRTEAGNSMIQVVHLSAQDPQVTALCEFHEVDPSLAAAGAQVSWNGSMAWDKEGEEGHQGSTVMVLIPDKDTAGRSGRLLREKGYAETAPVIGRFQMDAENALVLTTEYETMAVFERFWFADPNLRVRTNTVKWFGGFSSASFCTEQRLSTTSPLIPTVNWSEFTSAFGG
jgi:hypothetical protein